MAAVRDRTGANAHTDNFHSTGNMVAAVFHHDTSRALDPQLHAHAVIANATFDHMRDKWLALQPRQMMERSRGITKLLRRDLAKRLGNLGYTVAFDDKSFHVAGITKEMEEAYSQRAQQRRRFQQRYSELFGRQPTKARVEAFIKESKQSATKRFQSEFRDKFNRDPAPSQTETFVRDSRSSRLKHISTRKVRRLQQDRLTLSQQQQLRQVIASANHENAIKTRRRRVNLQGWRNALAIKAAFQGRPQPLIRANVRRIVKR